MRVTILGCGGSGGVPYLGGRWGNCDPANPKNRRRRVSALVEDAATAILIDSSPDLRQQLLDAEVGHLDAVLYTHDHSDHTHGIDDLRYLRLERDGPPLPAHGSRDTLASLVSRFGYAFAQVGTGSGTLYRPFLGAEPVDRPFEIGGLTVTPFEQRHGLGTSTTGYRIGPMAYSTDVVELPPEAFEALRGVELWIVDCLRYEPHPTHAHFEKALGWIERVRPGRAILTHLNHTLDYDDLARRCPAGVEPAYDGMVIEL